MTTIEVIRAMLKPIKTRVDNMVARAVVRIIKDSGSIQLAQVSMLGGETRDNVENFQPYGFAYNAPPGSEALLLFIGGNRDHPLIGSITNRAARLKNLASGEVALYTDEGDYIKFSRGQIIEVVAGASIAVTAPEVTVNGNLTVTGDLQVDGGIHADGDIDADMGVSAGAEVSDLSGSMTEMRGYYNSHVHGGAPDPNPQMT